MMGDITYVQPSIPLPIQGKGFWPRAGAYIIDMVIINLFTYGFNYILGFIFGLVLLIFNQKFPDVSGGTNTTDFLLSLISANFYFIIFECIYGGTFGKLILGMRVVMGDGEPCTFGSAIVRALFRYVDGLLFAIPAAASMKANFNQRIGDRAAHTLVVSAKSTLIKKHHMWWWVFVAIAIYIPIHTILILLAFLSYYQ